MRDMHRLSRTTSDTSEIRGDRSDFLITHEVRPINSSQARYQAPLAGKIKKTSSC